MQSFFETELTKLRKRILRMLELVDTQLDKSGESLLNQDFEMNDIAMKNENQLDKLDIKIDKLCQRIFALAQPVATDLRFIMSSLRIGNESERIGDIALDIISRSESVRSYPEVLKEYRINKLLKETIKINKRITEAYANNNNILAKEVFQSCKDMEDNCNQVFNEIIGEMTKKSQVITIATDLILIVRNIERISNHMENIADSIVFIAEGKRIKHS
ncbi:MAG TPA: phosphate signaling complex protein PhoU [Bacteroidales bacterium]|jgi:phosphate transport system protein|nr:phosphate signaling complex protein PhoU [Bacteroidales bacterium]